VKRGDCRKLADGLECLPLTRKKGVTITPAWFFQKKKAGQKNHQRGPLNLMATTKPPLGGVKAIDNQALPGWKGSQKHMDRNSKEKDKGKDELNDRKSCRKFDTVLRTYNLKAKSLNKKYAYAQSQLEPVPWETQKEDAQGKVRAALQSLDSTQSPGKKAGRSLQKLTLT